MLRLRREVLLFALAMQAQLDAHAPRWGESWKETSSGQLHNRLQQAVYKLYSAMRSGAPARSMDKCADAANMAMMIWDVLGGCGQRKAAMGERVMQARELLVDLHAEMSDQLTRSAGLPDVETLLAGLAMCMAELLGINEQAVE